MPQPYDIIIIGGGAAGFTAGLYAARDRCRALLLERFSAGGQVLNCEHIENYRDFRMASPAIPWGHCCNSRPPASGLSCN